MILQVRSVGATMRRQVVVPLALGASIALPAIATAQTFSEQAAASGLTHTFVPYGPGFPILQEWHCGGVGIGDFDRDSDPDLFVVGGGWQPDRYFVNLGDGTFTESSSAAGLKSTHCGNGVSVADFDHDGWLDIYVTSFAGTPPSMPLPGLHRLYRNNQDGTFTNVAAEVGVNFSAASEGNGYGSAWGDFDLDGKLDLFVTAWSATADGNRVYRNMGEGSFADLTDSCMVASALEGVWGFQPSFVDMNNDGLPEILLTGDVHTSRYFLNNGDGTFTDRTVIAGCGVDDNGMGQCVGDFNNDGMLDWYVTSIKSDEPYGPDVPGTGSMLYIADGPDHFIESSIAAGVNDQGWGWGAAAADLDNDGWLDIVATNGWPANGTPWFADATRVYHNDGDGTFTDVAAESGFVSTNIGHGLVTFDADLDGDLDVLIVNYVTPLQFWRNTSSHSYAWLEVRLATSSNPLIPADGFGARVTVTDSVGVIRVRYQNGAPSYVSTGDHTLHFGLGAADGALTIRVEWPRGYSTTLVGVDPNQLVTIPAPALADTNGDGAVDGADLANVLGRWGPATSPKGKFVDFNNDGVVDGADLGLLLSAWATRR